MSDDPIIRIDDIRKAGHCVWGARKWFADNDLDFRKFMSEGLPASTLLSVSDDALPRQVIDRKLKRESRNG